MGRVWLFLHEWTRGETRKRRDMPKLGVASFDAAWLWCLARSVTPELVCRLDLRVSGVEKDMTRAGWAMKFTTGHFPSGSVPWFARRIDGRTCLRLAPGLWLLLSLPSRSRMRMSSTLPLRPSDDILLFYGVHSPCRRHSSKAGVPPRQGCRPRARYPKCGDPALPSRIAAIFASRICVFPPHCSRHVGSTCTQYRGRELSRLVVDV